MEHVQSLRTSELNNFITMLKKAKLLGSSLLWVNDMILPHCKNDKVKGEHFVFNHMDNLGDYGNVLITEDIGFVLKQFDSIRGKKSSILYRRSDQYIIITINDVDIIVASLYYDDEHVDKSFNFHDLLCGEWIEFDTSFFEDLRDNKLIVINGPNNLVVRIAKSVIPSIGVQQKAWGIKYTGRYKITSGNRPELYNIHIHMTFESVEAFHRYKIVSYK